jgi:PTH1 family peptidyl-tRNA hydrolase
VPGLALKLVAGLGNPGGEYACTRHNVGFWFVEELARRHGGSFRNESKHQGEVTRVRVGVAQLWLLKPTTFMNNSGNAVRSLSTFYKVPVEEILVAYDELDFPAGAVRLKQGGGAAGHNGVSDVMAQLGADFWRLRIGIGKPPGRGIEHVLSRPSAQDERIIRETIARAADALPVMLEQGPQKAMNMLHTSNEN